MILKITFIEYPLATTSVFKLFLIKCLTHHFSFICDINANHFLGHSISGRKHDYPKTHWISMKYFTLNVIFDPKMIIKVLFICISPGILNFHNVYLIRVNILKKTHYSFFYTTFSSNFSSCSLIFFLFSLSFILNPNTKNNLEEL